MGYDRNDRRPGGYQGDRGYGDRYRDESRGSTYGTYGGSGARDYRGDRFNDDRGGGYGRDPRGYDYDRGFFERAGDEVRSWFGDEDAERRRRDDERRYEQESRASGGDYGRDERSRGYGEYGANRAAYGSDYGNRGFGQPSRSLGQGQEQGWNRDSRSHRDPSYQSWRDRQLQAFDQDYDDYRRENQSRFDQEFHSWRQGRQGQRDLLGRVQEHQDVVGSDGQHVGKVDHVRGSDIKLAKNDEAAGGKHHLIPASWIQSVDDKVTLNKTADQARQQWRDVERDSGGGLFGGGSDAGGGRTFDRAFGDTDRQR